MTDATHIPAPPAERLTFEQFLIDYAGIHADLLPDGTVEVHMGTTLNHQTILELLFVMLSGYLDVGSRGRALLTSLVMRLRDDLPKRQPDMTVILSEHLNRLHKTYIDGPADIVIEVVSPDSVERDYELKFHEYAAGGVQEYWLIDPDREIIGFYTLTAGHYTRIPTDAAGRVASIVLPGFAFDPELLWGDIWPTAFELMLLGRAMAGGNS